MGGQGQFCPAVSTGRHNTGFKPANGLAVKQTPISCISSCITDGYFSGAWDGNFEQLDVLNDLAAAWLTKIRWPVCGITVLEEKTIALEYIINHEPAIRMAVFFGILIVMAAWELTAPRRRVEIPRLARWSNNLGLVVLDSLLVRLAFPVVAVGLAVVATENDWGLLNQVPIPGWIATILAVLALDLAIYLQHVLFHAVPGLWRLHRVHHADLEFDVTTGVRFHPLEILISMAIKLLLILALGPPAIAVLIFEVLLNGKSLFNHSNVRLPSRLDALLRLIIVTPDMHRVHHSILPSETNSNFGFNLPWWDRLLGTYLAQPSAGHVGMTIGIEQFRTKRNLWIDRLLLQPFRGPASGYPLNSTDQKPEDDR
ncbi:hypothetical protein LCGC14_1549450 [marine sediment metagenome]|uniref:Fatty acid hydroxylase domain-containing protein n=1 Tax=marine sediment metagenome TaxID=412755 RepID=A0A0F9JBQ5_9ZZZZ